MSETTPTDVVLPLVDWYSYLTLEARCEVLAREIRARERDVPICVKVLE